MHADDDGFRDPEEGLDSLSGRGEPSLDDLSARLVTQVVRHPAFLASANQVGELITQLRRCASWDDMHDFQEQLITARLAAERDHQRITWAMKRVASGRAPQADAPDLPAGTSPQDLQAWTLERYLASRGLRHLRAVGDAMVWSALGCDRRIIMSYAGNASPGPLDKLGLDQERAYVDQAWAAGHFAILTGLSDCLRIDDVIVLHPDHLEPLEVKQQGRAARGAQAIRHKQAIDALVRNGPLPGLPSTSVLFEVPVDYATHLKQLDPLMYLTERDGTAAMKVAGGRALVGLNHIHEPLTSAPAKGWTALETAQRVARRRAQITGHPSVAWQSNYRAGRRAYEPPLGIYPVTPYRAAALICDLTSITSEVSTRVVADALTEAGISVRIPPDAPTVSLESNPQVVVLRASRGRVQLDITAGNLMLLAAELTHLDIWVEGFDAILRRPDLAGKNPLLIYANEATHWLGWPRSAA